MQISTSLSWLIPVALVTSACSSGDDVAQPQDGGATGGTSSNTGGAAGSPGGSAGAGGNASGGTPGNGGAGAGTSGGASGSGGAASTGGSSGSGGSNVGGALSYQCTQPSPNVTAPPTTWVNATGNLAGMASECGNLGFVSANPCSNMVIAGVAKAGLWATENGGQSWTKLGSGAGSAEITNRIAVIVYDPDHEGTFWESGIYNGGGVYKTTDNGQTFQQLGDATHNDSVSIDFTDPDRKTLLAGSHEQTSKLFRSTDGGQTWNDIGAGLPASAGYCVATLVLSATNLLVGCTTGGVYHSSDGSSWTSIGSKGVIPQPLLGGDGTIYWPGNSGGMNVSTDQGQHFTETVDGSVAPWITGPMQPAELPDGRVVTIGKDHLLISSDKGATWNPIGEPLPYPGGGYDGARGLAYSARTKTFYIWRWDCNTSVPSNAVMSAGFDYETQ
jgi:hypothetical protein